MVNRALSPRNEYDAVIVGAGPNGLSAAVELARAGWRVLVVEAHASIGGACRSSELTLPGYCHDVGSAIHPLAIASPYFRSLPLERYGLEWIQPDIPLAHPLGGGRAAALYRPFGKTTRALKGDAENYGRLIEPLVQEWEHVLAEILQPLLHLPRHPFTLARFGLRALWPAAYLARELFLGEEARALFAGVAAHQSIPLTRLGSSAMGLTLCTAAHAAGWPFPRGGAGSITNALAAYLDELGGEVITGWRVKSVDELPSARCTLLNLTPQQVLEVAGHLLPHRYRRRLHRYQYGPSAFKVDYALSEPIPWTAESCRRAGTVHIGGTLGEITEAEEQVGRGNVPERPFVLLAQQSLFDKSRAPDDNHTAWAYCHVPFGCEEDMTGRIERQIERFAPGFRDVVLARHTATPSRLEELNPNLVGGDINGGTNHLAQLLARPTFTVTPYRLPGNGLYMCSASTPPGGGVHGMCGYHAARRVLDDHP